MTFSLSNGSGVASSRRASIVRASSQKARTLNRRAVMRLTATFEGGKWFNARKQWVMSLVVI